MRKHFLPLVALATVLSVVAPGPAVALPEPVGTSAHIGLYAQDWNPATKTRSAANWDAAARNHDLLVGNTAYHSKIAAVKAANPNVTVCVYDLGPYTVKGTPLYDQIMREHPEYFARDAQGRLITVKAASASPAFPNNTLMDVGNPGWHALIAQRIAEEIAAPTPDFDCAYLDSMGNGPFTGGTTGKPMKPGAGRVYTPDEWFQGQRDMLTRVKTVSPDKYIFATGLVNGPNYKSFTYRLADSTADGFQTDGWMRLGGATPTQWPTFSIFQGNLDMVQSLHAKGKAFFGWTKIYSNKFTEADRKKWNDFTLGAYLLVKESRQYFTLTGPTAATDRTLIEYSNQMANLGAALGPYTKTAGCAAKPATSSCVFSRQFERGNVSVNPVTHAASINVTG